MNRHTLELVCLLVALLIWIQVATSDMLVREVELPLVRGHGLVGGGHILGLRFQGGDGREEVVPAQKHHQGQGQGYLW